MTKFKLEPTGCSYMKRVVDGNGIPVAMASQLTNGNWIAVDLNDHQLTDEQFKTAVRVKSWVQNNI